MARRNPFAVQNIEAGEMPTPPRRIIDRQINWTLVLAIIGQIIAGVWFASSQASTIKNNTVKNEEQDKRLEEYGKGMTEIKASIAVLMDRSNESLSASRRIEDYLRDHPARR